MDVITGIDSTDQRADAVALGRALAGLLGGDLHVAHVLPSAGENLVYGADLAGALRQAGQEILDDAVVSAGPGVTVHGHLLSDDSAPRALHALAHSTGAGLIVLGSSHRGRLGRALLGGTAERVAQGAPCAVAVAPRGYAPKGAAAEIGVAYDAGPESRAALQWAGELAASSGARLHVLTVVEPLNTGLYPSAEVMMREDVQESLETARRRHLDEAVAQAPPRARAVGAMLDGPAASTLAAAAEDLDLLVLGSRGYGPLGAVLLGGVSHGLLRDAPCPVVVLPRGVSAPGGEGPSAGSPPDAA